MSALRILLAAVLLAVSLTEVSDICTATAVWVFSLYWGWGIKYYVYNHVHFLLRCSPNVVMRD